MPRSEQQQVFPTPYKYFQSQSTILKFLLQKYLRNTFVRYSVKCLFIYLNIRKRGRNVGSNPCSQIRQGRWYLAGEWGRIVGTASVCSSINHTQIPCKSCQTSPYCLLGFHYKVLLLFKHARDLQAD